MSATIPVFSITQPEVWERYISTTSVGISALTCVYAVAVVIYIFFTLCVLGLSYLEFVELEQNIFIFFMSPMKQMQWSDTEISGHFYPMLFRHYHLNYCCNLSAMHHGHFLAMHCRQLIKSRQMPFHSLLQVIRSTWTCLGMRLEICGYVANCTCNWYWNHVYESIKVHRIRQSLTSYSNLWFWVCVWM